VEISGGLSQASIATDTQSFGTTSSITTTSTSLSSLAAAYPFPVYRGSFVVAAAYERPVGFDLLTLRAGTKPDPSGAITESDRVDETGGLRMYRVGVAADVAREVSIGGSAFVIGGSDVRSHSATAERNGTVESTIEQTDTHASGIGATVGSLFRLSPYSRLGLAVELPRHVTFKGTGTIDGESFVIEPQKFRLPYVFSAGLAITPPYAIVAADIAYTNWNELDYFGRIIYRDQFAYRSTTDVRLGAEVLVPHTLLRVRAGYQRSPLPLTLLADLTAASDTCAHTVYAPLDNTTNRHAVTLGAGYLIAEAFTLDVAWVNESFTRRTTREAEVTSAPSFIEDRTTHRLFASVAFRL